MSKNVWLERAEQKKQAVANTVRFKGKFQEANKINKQGRMYTSECLEKSIRDIAAEDKITQTERVVKHIKEHVPDATIFVNKCTRTVIVDGKDVSDEVAERWQAPSDDECGWIPIRPTADAIKLNQDSINQVSVQANEFHDLSAVKGSNSRYKEYDRLRLMEDAMVVYNVGRSVSLGPTGPVGHPGPQGVAGIPGDDQAALDAGDLGEQEDITYFKDKLFAALMPKEVSKKLASEDVRFARQYERETGESLSDWREMSAAEVKRAKFQRIEELKIEVMGQNPQILGMPVQSFDSVTISGPQHGYHNMGAQSIRFHPDQITYLTIGDERHVFSVDVKPQDSEQFIDKLKEMFKKKAREDKRLQNIEAQAVESKTWFSSNGQNRGNIPNIIDVFADVAAEAYTQLTAKIDHMCNECMGPDFVMNTPSPEGVISGGGFTITSPPPTLMADLMIGDGVVSGDYNITIGSR